MLSNRPALSLTQHASKGAGLPEPARHRGIASQKLGYLDTGKPGEDSLPLQEGGADLPAIPGHPTLEIPAGNFENPAVAAESACNQVVLCLVDSVHKLMREFAVHAAKLGRSRRFGE
jgi:hypothetical protein